MSSSSSSSSSAIATPEDKKLFYKANGESNLPVWRLYLVFRLKDEFGSDAAEMIETLAVPARLTAPYVLPAMPATTDETSPMSPMQERLLIKQIEKAMEKYLDAQTVWERAQAHITTRMIHLLSASSIARINSVYETEYNAAYTANNPLDLYNVIVMAHTFSGQTSGAEDRRQMTLEFVSFDYRPSMPTADVST